MKYLSVCSFILGFALLPGSVLANSNPVVSNVTAVQRTDGSGKVDIRYNLADADGDRCTVSLQVSSDDGATWTVVATSLTGAIGANISPGTGKVITWDAKADLPGAYGTNYRFRVCADDGKTTAPPDMVLIPGGTFQMGDSFSEGHSSERPVHTVTVDSFYMGRYEITNQQYCDFLNSANSQGLITVTSGVVYKAGSGTTYPYCDTSTSTSYSQIAYNGTTFSVRTKGGRSMVNDPMVSVTWYGAAAYCNWRSQQLGRQLCYDSGTLLPIYPLRNGVRLATEAEWEYAARGGLSGRRFPWGNDIYHTQANYYSDSSYSYDKGPTSGYHPLWSDGMIPFTSPVGFFDGTLKYKSAYNWPGSATSYQTTNGGNGYGLYDMAGNVWEWCNDWYASYSSASQTNPAGPSSGSYRVRRGGCWIYDGANFCREASRLAYWPGDRDFILGFRVVLDF